MKRLRTVGWVLLATWVLLAPAGIASAAPDKSKAAAHGPEDDNARKAREAFERASAHFDLNEWAPALEQFKEAYRLKPDPAFLYNIARCHHRLGHRDDAISFYNKYLSRARTGKGPAVNDEQVRKLIAELEGSRPGPVATPAAGKAVATPAAPAKAGAVPAASVAPAAPSVPTTAAASAAGTPGQPVATPIPGADGSAPAPGPGGPLRRATVIALASAGSRVFAGQVRQAMEVEMLAKGRAVVSFKVLPPRDADLFTNQPRTGDPAWAEAMNRLQLDEVWICRVKDSGILGGFTGPRYQIHVELYDRWVRKLHSFDAGQAQDVVGAGLKERLKAEIR